jgi:hypothetical protein
MTDKIRNPAKAAEAVVQRLFQMRQLWEDAAKSYFDPPRFQLDLQNCITVSRTVTFILQANKEHIDGFDDWYATHRLRWNNDPIMRWARDARNAIEKQGDLTTHSQVRATIIASYLDGPETEWLPQALFMSPEQVFRTVPAKFRVPHIVENGTLLIERRWVDSELPEIEVLEALSHVYGEFADVLVDFMNTNHLKIPLNLANTRPDAMGALAMDRALYLSMRDGSPTGNRYFRKSLERPEKGTIRRVKKRYGPGAQWAKLGAAKTFEDVASEFFNHARIVLQRDGYHRSLTFFLKGKQIIQMIPTDHPDRASRYVLMRDFAKLARIEGADGVFMIAEAWTAAAEDAPESGFAVDAKNRGEALMMHAANATGDTFVMQAPFYRRRPGGKKVKRVDAAETVRDGLQFVVFPFLREWGVLDMEKVEAEMDRMDKLGIELPTIEISN